MTTTELAGTTAIVTGASRGFGRAIAAALTARGASVVGIARDRHALDEVAKDLGDAFIPVPGDAADPDLAGRLVADHQPRTLVLNAGATPLAAPLSQQTWQDFSVNWESDVRQVFNFARVALTGPLSPGSTVISFSSGAAIAGSPLSGGYAGAKATVRFLSGYAGAEAARRSLGIRFVSVLPRITPDGGVGARFVTAYAGYNGLSEKDYLAGFGPVLGAGQVGDAVADIAGDDGYSAPAYLLTAAGLKPV
ncbi:MAG: SDR family oxidoreductase [Actinobacteria bacterium]|nr:SDR family oxidoreductase [Actinomycetota bacterium]MBO0785731.1 SDR family oxidoreductase [Actinomycetota bacterium]MBO0813974.1 SDR family oxidoreductase [Actinomycetota bacterium]